MSHRWAVLVGICAVLIAAGAVITWRSLAGAPAARIAAAGRADHQRALRLDHLGRSARTHTTAPTSTAASSGSVASTPDPSWDPTVAGQVASITIPALGVQNAPVLSESVQGGDLTIPADVHHVGWDSQTPIPGQAGISLLAGHVNWVGQGEGSLGEIGQLVPGDQVVVNWGGTVSTWQVSTKPVLSPNTEVHTALFTNAGAPRLALVTCGGPFSETASGGSYADNVIVEAVPAAN